MVREPFVEGPAADIVSMSPVRWGILAFKSPQMMVFTSKVMDPSTVKTSSSSREGGK